MTWSRFSGELLTDDPSPGELWQGLRSRSDLDENLVVDQVLSAEARLSDLQWLVRGQGTARTRYYQVESPLPPEEALAAIRSAISKDAFAGSFTSSTGIGHESLAGEVFESTFTAAFYDPRDVNVLPLTRVEAQGEVVATPNGLSLLRLWLTPAASGLIFASVCAVIGIGAFFFGIVQFASQQWWESFGITIGIALALWAVPCGLLWWAVREGRANERELLSRLGDAISTPEAPQ